jgi:histone-arginine methyltransferase CARM1
MSDSGDQVQEGEKGKKDVNPFSQYYAQLLHQSNMLGDYVRTGIYQQAILNNAAAFKDRVVLDVGTGSGILAFFAAQAGARKVYAVEASDVAKGAAKLAEANGFAGVVEVIHEKLEQTVLPEPVDIIVSEPIGFLLVHERMLETFIKARDMFLKPGGALYPGRGTIFITPVHCDTLHKEQMAKASFWDNQSFFGIDLSALKEQAVNEHFAQPVVGYFSRSSQISEDVCSHCVDFGTISEGELTKFEIPLRFTISITSILHGLGCWFDINFDGPSARLCLSTAPDAPGTHWYQCRLLFAHPLAVNVSQVVTGNMVFVANDKYSYSIEMTLELEGTDIKAKQNINLQDQLYHYLQQ